MGNRLGEIWHFFHAGIFKKPLPYHAQPLGFPNNPAPQAFLKISGLEEGTCRSRGICKSHSMISHPRTLQGCPVKFQREIACQTAKGLSEYIGYSIDHQRTDQRCIRSISPHPPFNNPGWARISAYPCWPGGHCNRQLAVV